MLNLDELFETDEPVLDDDNVNTVEAESDEESTSIDVPELNDNDEQKKQETTEVADEDAVAYFNYLKEVKVLDIPEDFEFKKDADSIQEALELTRRNMTAKVAQQIWNALPEDFKPLFQYGLSGGKNLKEYLDATAVIDVDDLELSDEISQKAVIRSYYKLVNPKLSEDQVEKRIERLVEIADLEEEANDAIDYLKNYKKEQQQTLIQRAQQQEQQRIEQAKRELETYSKLIEKDEEFDVNRKNRIKSFLFTPVNNSTAFENALDAIYENPQHKIQLANILADYDPKTGFNLDKLQKKITNKVTRSVKDLLNKNVDPKQQLRSTTKPGQEDFDWQKYFEGK